jgi:hypothetical protein
MLPCSISGLDFFFSFHTVALMLREQAHLGAQGFPGFPGTGLEPSGGIFDLDNSGSGCTLSYLMRVPQP